MFKYPISAVVYFTFTTENQARLLYVGNIQALAIFNMNEKATRNNLVHAINAAEKKRRRDAITKCL